MIQRIEALPEGVREMDIFQSMLAMERRRAADPAWQAEVRKQEAGLRRFYFVYYSAALCVLAIFSCIVLYDPFGLLTRVAQFTLDHLGPALLTLLAMALALLGWLKWPELVRNQRLRNALDALIMGGTLCVALMIMAMLVKFMQFVFQQA